MSDELKNARFGGAMEFAQLQDRCIRFLNERRYIYAATSYKDQVRSRIVDYVNDGLRIGFLTWDHTIKIGHIKNNPRVSLCVDALQIEGTAAISGHPSVVENAALMEIYKQRHPTPYRNFVSQSNTLLIKVEPTLLILMKYEEGHLCLDHLDVIQQRAFRKILSPWVRD
jgi:general stress protein 26